MAEKTIPTSGIVHGSNLITYVGELAIAHCSSCEIQYGTETKSRATKVDPDYSTEETDTEIKVQTSDDTSNDGKWDEKSISKMNVTITAEGMVGYDETGETYDKLEDAFLKGEKVKVKYAHALEKNSCYRVGWFLITALTRSDPSDDDSTFNVTFENSGPVRKRKVEASGGNG